jgi:predicted ABC-type ATPase
VRELMVLGGPNGAGKARRVRNGGHSIPDAIVVRRYALGLRNMRRLYLPLVDVGTIYDNSDDAGMILIAERIPEAPLAVLIRSAGP